MSRRLLSILFVFLSIAAFAKDQPAQVINWPDAANTIVRITFNRFREIGGFGNQHNYVSDTVAENLWDRKISAISFTLHVYDKNKVRIGDGFVSLDDVGAKQSVNSLLTFHFQESPITSKLFQRTCQKNLVH